MSLISFIGVAAFGVLVTLITMIVTAVLMIAMIRALGENGWHGPGDEDDDVDDPDPDPEPAGEEPAPADPPQDPPPTGPAIPDGDPYTVAREEVLAAIDSGDPALQERVDACLNPLRGHTRDCACGPCRDRLLANWIHYRPPLPAGGQA